MSTNLLNDKSLAQYLSSMSNTTCSTHFVYVTGEMGRAFRWPQRRNVCVVMSLIFSCFFVIHFACHTGEMGKILFFSKSPLWKAKCLRKILSTSYFTCVTGEMTFLEIKKVNVNHKNGIFFYTTTILVFKKIRTIFLEIARPSSIDSSIAIGIFQLKSNFKLCSDLVLKLALHLIEGNLK